MLQANEGQWGMVISIVHPADGIGEQGGHFAALEQPQAFLEDIEEFVLNVVGPL